MSIVEFLLARIAEDEAVIEQTRESWHVRPRASLSSNRAALTVGMHPSRARAECEAKRRIVEAHPHESTTGCETCDWQPWWPGTFREPCPTLRALAAIYADHPDFDEGWRAD